MKLTATLILLFSLSFSVVAQNESNKWTLQECIDYALNNNLDVKRSALNLQSRDIDIEQAKFARLPNLNANGSFGPNWGRSIDPTTNQFVTQRINSAGASASSSVTLFNAFRLQNTIKQAQYAFEASEEDLEVSKNNVILNVITFYTNVLFTRELYENAVSQLNSTKEQVLLTQKQVDAGALPKANLLDLQAQEATNEVNVITAENNFNLAKIQLKQILQLPPESEVEIDVPDLEVGTAADLSISVLEVYEIALASRPEIKSAELNIKSSELGIKASKASLYPTLSLSAGIRTNYSDIVDQRFVPNDPDNPTIPVLDEFGNTVFSDTDFITTSGDVVRQPVVVPDGELVDFGFTEQFDENLSRNLTFGISIPIFNGFSTRANIQRSAIQKNQADINAKDVKYQLWRTIEQAYNDVRAASASYNASLKAVAAREEAFRVTQQRKAAGAINATDYQIAENNLTQARNDLTRAKYDYIFKIKLLDFYQGKELKF